jgi:hypothetical protein
MASIGSLNTSLKLESAALIPDLAKTSQSVRQNTSALAQHGSLATPVEPMT